MPMLTLSISTNEETEGFLANYRLVATFMIYKYQ